MTKNISEEELLLRKRARRRLIGAVFLVILSIIVLPIFFDESRPENEQHEIAINLPSNSKIDETDVALSSRSAIKKYGTSNRDDWSTDLQNRVDQQNTEGDIAISVDRSQIPIPGIKPKFNRRDSTETKNISIIVPSITSSSIAVADTSRGFVIQLGAFSDQLKAKQQVESLISHGLKAYTEILKIDNNTEVTRVRIGPFSVRDTAESELRKVKKLGFDGVIASK